MTDAVCAFCGKIVVRAPMGFGADVRVGEKLFHLDCYQLSKRPAPPEGPLGASPRSSVG